ncbi:MAG: hypothetical protein NTW59_04540 [Candidatus Diapherotrites archaeon]|nr:hypothetical protein [Candidatus Diapherotrites archaeon]
MNIEEYAVKKFYDSKLLRIYRNGRLRKAARMSGVKDGDRVLDFGCYSQQLRRYLPKVEYFGYDKNKQFSNVVNWKRLKDIDIVFALAVFEHLPKAELEDVISQFSEMGVKKIVAEFPWEDSPVNRFVCWLFGFTFHHFITHVSRWRTIVRALDKRFECVGYKHLFWATWISVWEPEERKK